MLFSFVAATEGCIDYMLILLYFRQKTIQNYPYSGYTKLHNLTDLSQNYSKPVHST
jgi:hypothetical protein